MQKMTYRSAFEYISPNPWEKRACLWEHAYLQPRPSPLCCTASVSVHAWQCSRGSQTMQDMAVSALLLLLDMCLRPGADAAVRAAVFKSVRAAAADPVWTQGLVSTLNDLHGAFDGINTNSPGAMLQSLPEASLLLQLRQPPLTARRHEGTLHLSPEPHGPTKDPSAAQRGPLHGVSLRLTFFLEALMRIAPDPIMAAVKGPASEFSTLPPEVRWSQRVNRATIAVLRTGVRPHMQKSATGPSTVSSSTCRC